MVEIDTGETPDEEVEFENGFDTGTATVSIAKSTFNSEELREIRDITDDKDKTMLATILIQENLPGPNLLSEVSVGQDFVEVTTRSAMEPDIDDVRDALVEYVETVGTKQEDDLLDSLKEALMDLFR